MTDNVQLYREVLRAFNREGIEGVLPYVSEDVEVYDPDLPGDRAFRGHEGLRHVSRQLTSGFDAVQIRGFQLLPAGDRVVALLHTYGRGGADELEVEIRDAHTVTFHGGKIVYWRLYLDRREALADAGLGLDGRPPRDER